MGIAAAFAVEEQMKVEVEAKPFVPYMLATSPQLSPYYSMLYNPFSFVGYTNPQVEMFPHQLSVMKAISGKGTRLSRATCTPVLVLMLTLAAFTETPTLGVRPSAVLALV